MLNLDNVQEIIFEQDEFVRMVQDGTIRGSLEDQQSTSKAIPCEPKAIESRRVPEDFKLPTRFGVDLDQKLLNQNEAFSRKEYNAIIREVGRAVKAVTYNPENRDLEFVCRRLLTKYPQLIFKNTTLNDSAVRIISFNCHCLFINRFLNS